MALVADTLLWELFTSCLYVNAFRTHRDARANPNNGTISEEDEQRSLTHGKAGERLDFPQSGKLLVVVWDKTKTATASADSSAMAACGRPWQSWRRAARPSSSYILSTYPVCFGPGPVVPVPTPAPTPPRFPRSTRSSRFWREVSSKKKRLINNLFEIQ